MKVNNNTFHDNETLRQQKNLTRAQKRTNTDTKEGVLVNSYIKETGHSSNVNLDETMDTLVISRNTQMPDKLYENSGNAEKSLIPISGIALGVMGVITGLTGLIYKSSKTNLTIDSMKRLPSTVRNVAINEETVQALYRIVECPNRKTILAGAGVFALTAMAFMGKTFFDGFKDVWVSSGLDTHIICTKVKISLIHIQRNQRAHPDNRCPFCCFSFFGFVCRFRTHISKQIIIDILCRFLFRGCSTFFNGGNHSFGELPSKNSQLVSQGTTDSLGGYIMVKAEELSQEAIVEAILGGNYYSSSGPEIYDWGIRNGVAYVQCSPVSRVNFMAGNAVNAGASVLSKTEQDDMTYAEFTLCGKETYLRVECVDRHGKIAWSNPIFL